jgi:CheY-like chemotaxis protein
VGTTVFVELPISSNETVLIDDEIPTPIKSTDGLKANLTALIVDDVPHNLKLLEIQLKKTNFTPIKAENGQEAVDIYTKNPDINLILMDIQMPVMDGLQAIQLIRELEKNSRSHVPIVALSASVIEHEQQRCVDAGADLFIAKPVNFDKLIKEIKKIIPDTTYQQALELGLKPLSTFETIVLDEEASKDEHIDFHGSLDKLEEKLRSNLLEDSLRCLKSLKSTLPQECYNRIMADLSNFNFKSALQTLKTLQKK